MSASRESRLWAWLKKCKPEFRERLHMDRVENSVLEGMADVNGCLDGAEFWIELKCEPLPSNPETKIKPKFRPAQPGWLRKRDRAGGRALVLLQVGQGGKAHRYLVPGFWAPQMAAGMSMGRLEELSLVPPVAFAAEIVQAAAGYEP